jgi:aminopeptidase N
MHEVGRGILLLATAVALGAAAAERSPAVELSRAQAATRSERLRDVGYRLDLELGLARRSITGRADIEFRLESRGAGVDLDYVGHVQGLRVNGKEFERFDYTGTELQIPASALRKGRNHVEVDFVTPYGRSGVGLHRFDDPADGATYLYTNLQPSHASHVFPCFDQPDLKARFRLEVVAPGSWEVVSSSPAKSRREEGIGRARWRFEESPPISTYVFFLGAGPFVVWEDAEHEPPLRLLARRSMALWVPQEEWLELTRAGMKWFADYLGRPFPFAKYDQLLVPEFAYGAMENAGAATFSERFFRYRTPTEGERIEFGTTLLHELAHMWLGNLVTPPWWNDFWINESLATYLSFRAAADVDLVPDPWLTYFAGVKRWAYAEDRRATTHSLVAPVSSAREVFSRFDGITYGKGAATMQQLEGLVGEKGFRRGIGRFLSRFAYGSAGLRELMAELSRKGSPTDLAQWRRSWLEAPGLNSLEARFSCANGRIRRFELLQGVVSGAPLLRRHHTVVATFVEAEGRLREGRRVPATYEGAATPVASLVGEQCPLLVLADATDADYAELRLDPTSAETARTRLGEIPPPLQRAVAWSALWQSVQEGGMGSAAFLETALSQLREEENPEVVALVAGMIPRAVHYLPVGRGADERRRDLLSRVEDFLWERFLRSDDSLPAQRTWLEALAAATRTRPGVERLAALVDGSGPAPGFDLDTETRWRLIRLLSSFGFEKSEAWLEGEQARDRTGRAAALARIARAARPDPEEKQRWVRILSSGDSGLSFDESRAIARSLFPPHQAELRKATAALFFESLPRLSRREHQAFLETYASALAPLSCEPEGQRNLEAFLFAKRAELAPVVVETLDVALEEDARCVRARSLAWKESAGAAQHPARRHGFGLRGRLLVEGQPLPASAPEPRLRVRLADGGAPVEGIDVGFDRADAAYAVLGLPSRQRYLLDVAVGELYSASLEIDLSARNGPSGVPLNYWEDIPLLQRVRLTEPEGLEAPDSGAPPAPIVMKSPVDFAWDPLPASHSYHLVVREVLSDPARSSVVIDKLLATPYFHTPLVPSPESGFYELEISAMDASREVVGRLLGEEASGRLRFRVR